MKSIGLIGGMSWESTAIYYQRINQEISRRRGGLHSARLHLISLDFEDIAVRQRNGDWPGMASILADAGRRLAASGADCVLIATNTMHRVAPAVQAVAGVPLLHIVDATAAAIQQAGFDTVGVLGTRFTMEQPFYSDHFAQHGIRCVMPDEPERQEVHRVIFNELCKGQVREPSRASLREVIQGLQSRGAQGIVLGCTELTMLLGASDAAVPLFDTTALHAMAAVDFALAA